MKWEEIKILEEKKQEQGTYAAVTFDKATTDTLQEYIKENDIPNPLLSSKMHTTLLYSRKYCPDYKPMGKIDPPWIGTPTKLEVWPTRPPDGGKGSNCLVLRFNCDELNKRHEELMKEHEATYDFPDYKTHISLSYDIGEMDWKKLPAITKYLSEITIVEEYGDELKFDVDYAKKLTDESKDKKDE